MNRDRIEAALEAARLPAPAPGALEISGADPVLGSRFAVGDAAATACGLAGAAAADLWCGRGGRPQTVEVDVAHAAAALLGFVFQRVEGRSDLVRQPHPTVDLFRAGDGRWIHLHGGFPHLAAGTLELLGCKPEADRSAIATAVEAWRAFELEDALAERGLCGAAVRSPEEWRDHAQGRALAPLPAVVIERIGDAQPEALPDAPRPLAGVRVLDLTRVLAGPSCARTLAEHGAEVLRIGAERLPSIELFVVDTGRGKRNAFLDLDSREDVERLEHLVRGAHVFSQGYRSGSLARRGFAPEALARLRPGIVAVSIDCYGPGGPWTGRPGWEQLAQSAVGIAHVEGGADAPRLIPAAATDYTTGALAAWGVIEALRRRAREGGSWHVRASLAQTGLWLQRLGADRDPAAAAGLGDVGARFQSCDTEWGPLHHLPPVARLPESPARWERPPAPLGHHAPEWLGQAS